jgi:Protein of unknown function (DUF1499)
MKRLGRMLGFGVIVLIVLAVGLAAYVRLAPSDPGRWHLDMAAPGFQPPARAAAFCPRRETRYDMTADPFALLARLDEIALAAPGTTRLAGSAEDGRITWITRSRIMGFPDFTTAQVITDDDGPRLCIIARQRFGDFDWGVNARRVGAWTQELLGLNEPPPQIAF